MATKKMKWTARFGYRIVGFPGVKFEGRDRFTPLNEVHKKALLDLGVFSEDGDQVYYSAPIRFSYSDGTKVFVDSDGFIEYDELLMTPQYRAAVSIEVKDNKSLP